MKELGYVWLESGNKEIKILKIKSLIYILYLYIIKWDLKFKK